MTSPVFVTFTNALVGSNLLGSGSIYVSSQAPIVGVYPITPGTNGTDGALSAVSMIKYASGGADFVSGLASTVKTSLGIVAPSGPIVLCNTPLGNTAYGSLGTDAVSVSGTQYFVELFSPTDRLVTNIAALNGSTAATDKVIYFLCDNTGAVLATTTLAGVLCATGDSFQPIALTAPVTISAGRYWAGFQVNGATTKHRTIAASTFPNCTGSLAGTFGTIAAITPTTTTTAGVGPFMQLT